MTIDPKKLARRFRDPEAEAIRIREMLRFEREFWQADLQFIAGIDEAGRGPLAGPVVAAAVVFSEDVNLPGIDDSKKLTQNQREALVPFIRESAVAAGIGVVDAEIIDTMNIRKATHLAMITAVKKLDCQVDAVLVDGLGIPNCPWRQKAIAGGDRMSYSIAAASILAKVHRDQLMVEFDALYPEYGFAGHKGYGSQQHCAAIAKHGPCPIHRRSFGWGSASV